MSVPLLAMAALVASGQALPTSPPETVTVASGTLHLTGLLWRPAAAHASAAVLFNHGSECTVNAHAQRLGALFSSHGYVFLYLARRGHGPSAGQGACAEELMERERTERGADAWARLQFRLVTTGDLDDVLSGLGFLKSQSYVDSNRMVVAGHSFGGQLSILAAERDSSIRAALDFAGAAAIWSASAELRARLMAAVRRTVVPTLIVHAGNDYSVAPGEAMAAELKRLGKPHELKIYPSFGETALDGHRLVYLGSDEWEAAVFRFLDDHLRATHDTVSIATPDGGVIHGDLYGAGTRGVVLIAHGGYSYKARWAPQARALAAAGFRVLAFDTRAGATLRITGKETECLSDAVCMAVDVLAAVRYLRNAGVRTIAVVGGSAGGGAAAQASVEARPDEIDRLVLLAPMSIAAPEKITGRKLYITSRNDRNGDGLRLPGIRDQYNKAPKPKRLVILEGSAHGQLMFDAPEDERLLREILSFLREP